jgi:hypothetical protein
MMVKKFTRLVARLCRRPAARVGVCQACRTIVRADDDWRYLGIGVAHRECAEYVQHKRRQPRHGWAA